MTGRHYNLFSLALKIEKMIPNLNFMFSYVFPGRCDFKFFFLPKLTGKELARMILDDWVGLCRLYAEVANVSPFAQALIICIVALAFEVAETWHEVLMPTNI